jgi:hypothetical protein
VGLGNADYTTRKVANHLDLSPIYVNSITAAGTESAHIPAVLDAPDNLTGTRRSRRGKPQQKPNQHRSRQHPARPTGL